MIGIIAAIIQNLGNRDVYSLGLLHTQVPNTTVVFIVKIIYVLFWTYILNLICKDGHKEISWFLVIVPFILLFAVIGMTGTNIENFALKKMGSKPVKYNTNTGIKNNLVVVPQNDLPVVPQNDLLLAVQNENSSLLGDNILNQGIKRGSISKPTKILKPTKIPKPTISHISSPNKISSVPMNISSSFFR